MKPIVEKALKKALLNNWGGIILGSLQEHASIDSIDGVCPTLGTTDFGMPKIIEMEAKVKQIGNLVDDTNIGYKNPIRGRVYSPEGIAPTLDCCGGGGREPKIIQYELSKNWSGTCRQQDKVFDDRGISGTTTAMHERHPFKILETMEEKLNKHLETSAEEPNVMVQRRTEYGKSIRKDYEQGNVKEQRKNIQRLEPRTDGVTNTLTSVQKDNLLVEPTKVIGSMQKNAYQGSADGVSPCVTAACGMGGWQTPMVMYEPSIAAMCGGPEDKGEEPKIIQRARGNNRGGEKEICTTITGNSWQQNNFLGMEQNDSTVVYKGKEMKDGDGLYLHDSEAFQKGGAEGVSRTLKAEKFDAAVVTRFRIRKLTERECFRLQGVTEEDIDKIQAYRDEKGKPISKTQQYKMAGNSITVDVMAYIFRNLFDMNATKGKQVTQLTLF